jgi:hypothetical protein
MTDRIPDSIPALLTIVGGAILLIETHLEETKQVLAILAIIVGIVLQILKFFRDRKLKDEIEQIKVDRSMTKEILNQRLNAVEAKLNNE